MKKRLSYLFQSLFAITLFLGYSVTVNAEEIIPNEIKSQIRTIYTDGTTSWYTSTNNNYTTPLYFGTGPSYSTYGIPCNFRLLVVSDIESSYSYKYSYDLHIFTPYSTSNTWDSSKIDDQYDIRVADDAGIVKESKCSVVSTEKNTNALGTFMNKSISCVFTVNKNYTNAYISAGYFCKGNCNLSNMEPLGFIPQDSYMSIDNVRTEKLSDNSNVIIDQNQTIIDQNNQTNEKLDDVQQSIIDSNKETQDVIKDQFNTCRDSINLFGNLNWQTSTYSYFKLPKENTYYTLSIKLKDGKTIPSGLYLGFTEKGDFANVQVTKWIIQNGVFVSSVFKDNFYYLNNSSNIGQLNYISVFPPNNMNSLTEYFDIQLEENQSFTTYEPYGEKICTNKLDDVNNTSKGIWETLKSIPNLILEGIKGLFVPSKEELQSLIDEFKQTMENKLGAIYQVSDMLIDVFRSIFSPTDRNSCITFPEIKDPMFNKLIIEQTDYCFDSLRTDFDFLFTISDMIISIVCTLAFGNMLYRKYEGFIGGDTSDY